MPSPTLAAEGDEARADPRGRRSGGGEDDADAERREHPAAADSARRAGRAERAASAIAVPSAPASEPEREALERGERDEVAAAGAARAQEREVAPVALGGPERGQVGEPERDERAGHARA